MAAQAHTLDKDTKVQEDSSKMTKTGDIHSPSQNNAKDVDENTLNKQIIVPFAILKYEINFIFIEKKINNIFLLIIF